MTSIHFKYPWRDYQARVLNNLQHYREDGRIHVVAPPGAGKTVLGLEIVRQLGKRALILAPSLTIRQQWAQRLVEDFGATKKMISHRLDKVGEVTIVTYQAVFQYVKNLEETGGELDLPWLELLVVDECHHLRNEWWRVLSAIYEKYQPELVALTATPPYDVSSAEWSRYHSFCGEVDEEISIPELVASGDLCPHQDYIYPVLPSGDAAQLIEEWAAKREELYTTFHERTGFALFLREHPWLKTPEQHYEAIFEQPEYFTALLSVLRAQGSEPPASAMGVLHGETAIAPPLNDHWVTVFLQRALRQDKYFESQEGKEWMRPFRRLLTAMNAWQDGRLELDPGQDLRKSKLDASAKLQAVQEIVAFESEELREGLRLVILTDFILPELLPTTEHDRTTLRQISASSIFETLRRELDDYDQQGLSVLTGGLVIIPQAAESRLLELAYDELPTERTIKTEPLFPNSNYLRVNTGTLDNKYSVRWVTQLFTEGHLRIIIGTKSLLGEGWDAPAINALVLANRVGSFVSSNQMRGRAIRTLRDQPNKTANIWHPVEVFPGAYYGGKDVLRLRRRFKAFAAPSAKESETKGLAIQNGISRFGLNWKKASVAELDKFRKKSLDAAQQRSGLNEQWKQALATGRQLVEAVRPPSRQYFSKQDKLAKHYKMNGERFAELELRNLALSLKISVVLAFATACLGVMLQLPSEASLGLVLAAAAFPVGRRYLKLYQEQQPRLEEAGDAQQRLAGLAPTGFLIFPLLMGLLLIPWAQPGLAIYLGCLGLFAGIAGWITTPAKRKNSNKRFELLADARRRLSTYGEVLAKVLEQQQLFHKAQASDLKLEEDLETGDYQCFLSDAEQHDSHLFADALSEFFAPVENPRWLLRLKLPNDWTQGDYYLPVPKSLSRKAVVETLAQELGTAMEHEFEPIFTREPVGRLHLLTARLQDAGRGEEAVGQREMLWR
ncbi:MAG: DEAD/DEAH box helicase family protein [Bacteroidota bacterium]